MTPHPSGVALPNKMTADFDRAKHISEFVKVGKLFVFSCRAVCVFDFLS